MRFSKNYRLLERYSSSILFPFTYRSPFTYTLPDGREYVGEFKNGKYNGRGTLTWFSEDKYVGKFKDGLQNGQGTFTFSDGREYVEEFKDGNPWKGTMYIEGNLIGKWLNGKEQ